MLIDDDEVDGGLQRHRVGEIWINGCRRYRLLGPNAPSNSIFQDRGPAIWCAAALEAGWSYQLWPQASESSHAVAAYRWLSRRHGHIAAIELYNKMAVRELVPCGGEQ